MRELYPSNPEMSAVSREAERVTDERVNGEPVEVGPGMQFMMGIVEPAERAVYSRKCYQC
jgi:hypothetical protein